MNIDKEIEDINNTISRVREEIRQAEMKSFLLKRGRALYEREDARKFILEEIILEEIASNLANASNSLSAKSMDINVQLENVRQ